MPSFLPRLQMLATTASDRVIFTFFHEGSLVTLPTRWLRFISQEPRYSPQTIKQYGKSCKDLLEWLLDTTHYTGRLDTTLKVVTRGDIQDWITHRKAKGLSPSTIR